jgi:hypothetical protein
LGEFTGRVCRRSTAGTYWLNQSCPSPASLGDVCTERFTNSATKLPHFFMLNEYFSDDKIINHLCKERLKLAESRHEREYISRLTGHFPESESNHLFYQLVPPRRQWFTFRPRYRSNGMNPDLLALKNAVRVLRVQQSGRRWVSELNRYIVAIQGRVFGNQPFVFNPPRINWQRKTKKEFKYRALCRFEPDDNLILCLFARYLRDAFDPLFSGSSYAFRSRNSQGQMPTHHQAFTAIYNLKHSQPNRNLYVAECDIQGFFDSVDHDVALSAFQRAAQRVNLHPRAEVIFRAYLNCYSFPVNVLNEAEPRLKRRDQKGYFKWPEPELHNIHKVDPRSLRIGVPQGGAISGIIANLILDAADKRVEEERYRLGAEIHYFRFCDDMILVSPVKRHCKIVFDAYLRKLDDLKLPYHRPEPTLIYDKTHWNNKSKAPYCWSGSKWFWCVPWVQFVGYQIRYDGLLRPRKESIIKQALRMVDTTDILKFSLITASREHPVIANRLQTQSSLNARLVAQSVGRVKGDASNGPMPMCWASGFAALHNKPFVSTSLRILDRARQKQISRFGEAQIRYGDGRNSRGGSRRNPVGYAFSYHAQFRNADGLRLIMNPWRPGNLKDIAKYFVFRICKRVCCLMR